jgi:RNA polymerase sigma-70 factor (ECF subfamily)
MNEGAGTGQNRGEGAVAPFDTQHLQTVLSRAVRRVCPGWLAQRREDIVQNALVRIVRKWSATEEPEALGTSYLWRVAHTTVMDEIRHRRRHPEDPWESPPESPTRAEDSPESRRESVELRRAIEAGLESLPVDRRRAVALFLLGHSLKESAEILGWTPKRVDNQRYQGLAALRRYLAEQGYEP